LLFRKGREGKKQERKGAVRKEREMKRGSREK